MAETKLYSVLHLLILLVFLICCYDAANVQFYWEHDFKGDVYEANSSTSCKNLPNGFANVNGSVRTTGCIAVFQQPTCDEKYNGDYAFLVKSEEKQLNELAWKYDYETYSRYTVSSYRDCTDMEKRPQVDLDLFEMENFEGKVAQLRDVCSCTNLKQHGTNYRSAKTYGNCFKMYSAKNCGGAPKKTRHNTHYFYIPSVFRSLKPCHPPQVKCDVRFNFEIYGIHHNPDFSKPANFRRNVTIAEEQEFINNGSSPIEHYFVAKKEVSEYFQFQLINASHSIDSFTFTYYWVDLDLGKPLPWRLNYQLQSFFRKYNSNGTVMSKRELSVRERLTLPPCTKLEVKWLLDELKIENDFDFNLRVSAKIQGSKRMEAKFIPHYFEGLDFSQHDEGFTAVTKIPAAFLYRFADARINVTTEPILDCPQQYIKLTAQVTNIKPITEITNLNQELQKSPMSNTQSFTNNGTTLQEEKYTAEMEFAEIGQLQFPIELNQISSVGFHKDLQIDEVPSIPLLTIVWTKLKSGEMSQEKNETNTDTSFNFMVRNNKSLRFEEKIAISQCTEYDVESFVKTKTVEIDYKIQLQVTGKQLSESLDADNVRENLEGLTFVRNEDNFTVVVETTGKLILNHVVGTGVSAEGIPIPECYENDPGIVPNCKLINKY